MVKVKFVESGSYSAKLIAFYLLLIIDVITNAYTFFEEIALPGESDYASAAEVNGAWAIIGMQSGIQVLICCWIFFLIWQTFLFRFGLIGILCREFKTLFIVFPIHLLLFFAEKSMRCYFMIAENDPIDIWDNPTYLILFYVRMIFMVFFYIILVELSLALGDPVYYKPHKWLVY